jgi:hypothetical protein
VIFAFIYNAVTERCKAKESRPSPACPEQEQMRSSIEKPRKPCVYCVIPSLLIAFLKRYKRFCGELRPAERRGIDDVNQKDHP